MAASRRLPSRSLGLVTVVDDEQSARECEAAEPGELVFTRRELAAINGATLGEQMPAASAAALGLVKRAFVGARVIAARVP